LPVPTPARLFQIQAAFEAGFTVEDVAELTKIDPWFLCNMKEIVDFSAQLRTFAT
nr:carbamoyl-phosphate synthase subunit L [Candidatus Latescibacterota bacterium]